MFAGAESYLGLKHIWMEFCSGLLQFACLRSKVMEPLLTYTSSSNFERIPSYNQWRGKNINSRTPLVAGPGAQPHHINKLYHSLLHASSYPHCHYLSWYLHWATLCLLLLGFFVSCYPFIASLVDFSPHLSALTLSWLTTVHAGARTAVVMTGLADRLNWTCVRSPSVCVFCLTIHYQHFLLSILFQVSHT